jgi:hypothetical protein
VTDSHFRRERFQAQHFDFRGKSLFTRFDDCEFVKCTLLIDHGTEQLAFTECVFKDCNIDKLEADLQRGLYVSDNFFDRPLEERRAEFENRLAQVLAARKAKGNEESISNRTVAGKLMLADGIYSVHFETHWAKAPEW